MKTYLSIVSVLLAFTLPLFSQNSEKLSFAEFEKIAGTKDYQFLSYKKTRSGEIVSMKIADKPQKDYHYAVLPVDISKYAGREAMITFDVKDNCTPIDSSKKSERKMLLTYMSGGKKCYSAFWSQSGYKWNEVALNLNKLPDDATNGRLVLGLINLKGEIQFRNLKIHLDESARLWGGNLPANFKCEYTDSFKKLPRMRGATTRLRISEAEIMRFKQWNGNLLRTGFGGAPADERFNYTQAHEDLLLSSEYMELYDQWLEKLFPMIRNVLDICAKNNIKVVVALFSYPGFRYWNKDLRMFNEKRYADKFVEVWKRIATEFKGHPAVWCYDLINEPIQTRPSKYDAIYLQYLAAKAIREVDEEVAISVEPIQWGGPKGFKTLVPIPLKNIIYQAHMYTPHTHTHYNVGARSASENPPIYPDENANRKLLEETLVPVVEFQKKWNAQIYIGEFSCVRWLKGSDKYIADCIDIFEKQNWHWSYHSYCEGSMWNVEYGSDKNNRRPTKEDSPAKKILLKAYSKNKN